MFCSHDVSFNFACVMNDMAVQKNLCLTSCTVRVRNNRLIRRVLSNQREYIA